MKITMLLIGLLSCINAFAQDVPELPIKNDYVYYVFDHKLDNTKKCLSYYHNNGSFQTNYLPKTFNLSSELSNGARPDLIMIFFNGFPPLDCSDTLTGNCVIQLPTKLPSIFGDYKSGHVTVTADIIFLDKNSYKITFKAFTCMVSGQDFVLQSVDLEDFYKKFKENNKKSKYDIAVFTLIDNAVKGIDKVIFESFKKAYQTDEL